MTIDEFMRKVKVNGIPVKKIPASSIAKIQVGLLIELIESAYSHGRAATQSELSQIVAFDPLCSPPRDSGR